MAKETKLDDSAGIYVKRVKETEKQKISHMSFNEKVTYFKDYYLKTCIVILIVIGMLGCIIYGYFAPKPEELLSIAIINEDYDHNKLSTYLDDMDKYFDVQKDKQEILYDYSYFITGDGQGDSANSIQKLYTHVAAKQIDVIIADESTFKYYTDLGYFIKLNSILPDDLLNDLSSELLTAKLTKDNSNDNVADTKDEPYGIYLNSSDIYKASGSNLNTPVLGIVLNSPHKDNDIKLIRYYFNKPEN